MDEPLRDAKGLPICCGHPGCTRNAVRVIAWEAPKHKDFHGRTHDCCSVHSRGAEVGNGRRGKVKA